MPVLPLSLIGIWAYALSLITVSSVPPTHLLAAAAASVTVVIATVLAVRLVCGVPAVGQLPGRPGPGAHRPGDGRHVPRQADPDAPGRPRPRAPGRPFVTA
ncbi:MULTISPECIES: DUF6412 domain-containing protein [unclassified Solwaraspora]|uniref:DUF6412 domain-containing protein n=1 Tax=unclassified Solwaraspora TaxID=2627926 RepID=UPI00259B5FB8|nr:DUF6412 domain-containing protein [Solwaraspora sp. WMMA2056]WJK40340.1 DUF6412 domain-containing protein [Solwaraspora sp. WMMA2056]